MKKILFVLFTVLLASVSSFAATGVQAGDSATEKPADVVTFVLHNNTAGSIDTFSAGECTVYGPYSMTSATGTPMYKGFQVYAKAITGTTPTMDFAYQLIPTDKIADTLALWTSCDTLDGTGANAYVDLSSKAGVSIVFRVANYDDTESVIPNFLKVMFKKAMTYAGR